MRAYVAVTDNAWFDFLSHQPGIDEVNFWTPNPGRGSFRALRRGEPLLFKLRAPNNAIAGGAFFEHYSKLPISLAWDAFGIKNGAASFETVRDSIARLRREPPAPSSDYTIGCILLVEPFFWPREMWIPDPPGFSREIVSGKGYDLTTGDGRWIWGAVTERMRVSRGGILAERPQHVVPGGYGDPLLRSRRIGQGTFRVVVTDAYQRRCAITGEKALPALEAAHIRPFSIEQTHSIPNGLLLRSDVHRLFDAGYLTVTPEHRVEASNRMRDDFNDGDNYMRLHGSGLLLPTRPEDMPSADALRWHNENRFRG